MVYRIDSNTLRPLIGLDITTTTQNSQNYPSPSSTITTPKMNMDYCVRCNCGGYDVCVNTCGCKFHARCIRLGPKDEAFTRCPHCGTPSNELSLVPLSFVEIDAAKKAVTDNASSVCSKKKRGRKRRNSNISVDEVSLENNCNTFDDFPNVSLTNTESDDLTKKKLSREKSVDSDFRTGRWTCDEMAFCDKLISNFKDGQLPLTAGMKLNDFLASMLKSKQSRLTKKMKNAKLSSNTFIQKECYIKDQFECHEFSTLEDKFFSSIQDPIECAELRFHMQKEWRYMFSKFCAEINQPLQTDTFTSSVEEMERRISTAKETARNTRKRLLMSYALGQDLENAHAGIFIEKTTDEIIASEDIEPLKPSSSNSIFNTIETDEFLSLLKDDIPTNCELFGASSEFCPTEMNGSSSSLHPSPFLSSILSYIKRYNIPFEHIDAWAPSFATGKESEKPKCRLCFAGTATSQTVIPEDGKAPAAPIESEDQFNYLAFGDYSQKFSFDFGCGLPGRIHENGVPIWENDPKNSSFERVGGALQWGINTIVGIPVNSPNAGRIVVMLYSKHFREKNDELLIKLSSEFSRYMPVPKWKLVVDMSDPNDSNDLASVPSRDSLASLSSKNEECKGKSLNDVIALLGEQLPSSSTTVLSPQHMNMVSLRLFLLSSGRSKEQEETVQTILGSFSSYLSSGRSHKDIATMLSRDFTFLQQSQDQYSQPKPLQHHSYLPLPYHNQKKAKYDLSQTVHHNHNVQPTYLKPMLSQYQAKPPSSNNRIFSKYDTRYPYNTSKSSFNRHPMMPSLESMSDFIPPPTSSSNAFDSASIVSN
mmetsp:Transcript_15963/g.22740  ORF Transcript_15963/g.22740 Transcript_15963/m.22740 type:complete len:818 (-) Transcript_15963:167-2620(-)